MLQRQTGKRILVIQTAFVGDLLLSIPLLKTLREIYPDCLISLLCRAGLGEMMRELGLLNEVIEINKSESESRAIAQAKLKQQSWDIIVCPHESLRSQLLVRSLKAPLKIGYRKWWNGVIFNERIARPMSRPEALRQLALLQKKSAVVHARLCEWPMVPEKYQKHGREILTEFWPVPPWASLQIARLMEIRSSWKSSGTGSAAGAGAGASPSPSMIANTNLEKYLQRLDLRGRPLAILSPGSVWKTKMWTADGFAQTGRELLKKGYQVAIIGAPNEKEIASTVAAAVPGCVNLVGEISLTESMELLAIADLLISNDSGAMHMAACAGTPTVSVFGPTTLDLGYRPWQNQARVVQIDLPCRPCGKHGSQVCPIGTHECMKGISADMVLSAGSDLPRP
jgi:heptosyltransferase-2